MKIIELFESAIELSDALKRLDAEIDQYLEAGEILNPDYERLKQAVNRTIERDIQAHYRHVEYREDGESGAEALARVGDEALEELIYAVPHNTSGVLSLKSKLAKVKAKSHPLYKAVHSYYTLYSPIAAKMKDLKDKVVKITAKRAEAKVAKEVAYRKKFTDSEALVKILTADIERCMDYARKRAEEQYEYCMSQLEKHDWDLDKAAPRPTGTTSKERYRSMNEKRNFLASLTVAKSLRESNIRVPSSAKKTQLKEDAARNAHESYMAWVNKIIDKIGKIVQSAEMHGDPWTGSTLSVVTQDGEEQTWSTKMIVNASKYGTLFNQFPSRRVK